MHEDIVAIQRVAPAGSWEGPALDVVTLDYDSRFRRRLVLATDGGRRALLDLERAQLLRDGDGLITSEGVIAVRAAAEDLAEARCADPALLLRIAWHLGNRHLPTELSGEAIRIRRDHVIEALLRQLGAEVMPVRAPFNPEGGAYGGGGHHEGEGAHHHRHA